MKLIIKIVSFLLIWTLYLTNYLYAETITFEYDEINQLEKVSSDAGYITVYQYDGVGNRLQKTIAVIPTFTDDPIEKDLTTFNPKHITELRTAVDTLRSILFGWEPYDWADDSYPPESGGPILASYITKLRAAVKEIYDELEQSITWGEDIIVDQTGIKAEHINELRQAIKDIW